MSSETSRITSELNISAAGDLNFNETELTLGLPGESRGRMSGAKRGFSKLGSFETNRSEIECSGARNPPPAKEHVGWPPVRSHRKNMMKSSSCKYIKVAVDGAPYLRKVDLETYAAYQQLMCALEDMFSCFTIRNVSNEKKLMDPLNGMEYVPTYEDKDGDWMLVGDVPWKMFVETCKRIKLMKSTEAMNELGICSSK